MTTFGEAREIVDAFAAALNAKDAEALGELFSDDAEFVNILGMRMREREGIVAGHAWAFAGPLQGRVIDFDAVDELHVTDDVSFARALRPQAPSGLARRRAPGRRLGPCLRRPSRPRRLAGSRRDERYRGSPTRLTSQPDDAPRHLRGWGRLRERVRVIPPYDCQALAGRSGPFGHASGPVTGTCCLCQIGRCAAPVRPSLHRLT